jgi:bifunctional non-homologous end joining protein LigD
MSKQARTGKVFVDWSQNDEHKTTIAVYSLRARERPTVSTPVRWDEVERALKKKDAGLLVFEAAQVVARFEKMGGLFEPVLELKQRLPDLKKTGSEPAAVAEAMETTKVPTHAAKNTAGRGHPPRTRSKRR